MKSLTFEIQAMCKTSHARLGRVTTPHGSVETPAFMPVGTQASVKGLFPDMVASIGAQIVLANTYHLMLRPGSELIHEMGGLHNWMGWQRPILTDSGGYQVFSLSKISRINDDGVRFQSHLDGQTVDLTPERSMRVQNELGADIIMAFDDCPPALAPQVDPSHSDSGTDDPGKAPILDPREYAARLQQSCDRTAIWLERSVRAHARSKDQALFGIVQGGVDLDQRTKCVAQVTQHDLPGYAIGGVAVGEGYDALRSVVEHTAPLLPTDRPRYLMGVGYERDLLAAVRAGVDMFDCVLPTRNGRNAHAFTSRGRLKLRNAKHARDRTVIEPGCDCPACGGAESASGDGISGPGFSRSYIRHLFLAGEMMGPILVTLHNLRHFQRFMLDIRRAISDNDWSLIANRWPVAVEPPAAELALDA